MSKSKTLAEVADKTAQRTQNAKAEREALRVCNTGIHALGGAEKAVWGPLSNGVTLGALAERLGVSYRTPTRWLAAGERQAIYEECKRHAAQRLAEDTLTISDKAEPSDVQVARLRVDTRRWLAAKYDPMAFGDRTPATVQINLQDLRVAALRHVEMLDKSPDVT